MRIVYFCHSLVSDWNHGNAHFLRGCATELLARGHDVRILEPHNGWSLENLKREHGEAPIAAFHQAYPTLRSRAYDVKHTDLGEEVAGADVVIVHEWNDPELVARLIALRRRGAGFRLLFHDTHHRAVTAPEEMSRFPLREFDGALVFGHTLKRLYAERDWTPRVWTWHEAADTRIFRPRVQQPPEADVVWIGNWGDEERTEELETFLIRPVRDLKLQATVHGVRYPPSAIKALRDAGIEYRGWLPNFHVPRVYARHRLTLHIPRRPYAEALPGIPTIRVFEALACGMPLITSPWRDSESLFKKGDFLMAADGDEMKTHIRATLENPRAAQDRALRGVRTISERHTCARRVDELLTVLQSLGLSDQPAERHAARSPVNDPPRKAIA